TACCRIASVIRCSLHDRSYTVGLTVPRATPASGGEAGSCDCEGVGGGVGGAEEAADGVGDVDVVVEPGCLARVGGVQADVDVVAAGAVRVVYGDPEVGALPVVGVGQDLVAAAELGWVGAVD